MEYYYMIVYAYEEGYKSTSISLDKEITDYQDIKEIKEKIDKNFNIHSYILDYKLITKFPKKESKFDTMDVFEYLEYLEKVVNNWNKKVG